jgi:undecaprenyl-diphosphatase
MEAWLQNMMNYLPDGGVYYTAIGFIALFESLVAAGIILPGSTLIVFAGFLALHGRGDIGLVIGVATFGAFWGDMLSYWLGGRYGETLLTTRLFRREHRVLEKAAHFFAAHGGKSVFFGRFVGPIRGFVPFVAGCARMPPRLFTGYAIVSAILWGLAYPGLGYLAGVSWQNVRDWSGRFSLLILLLLAVTVLIIMRRRRLH